MRDYRLLLTGMRRDEARPLRAPCRSNHPDWPKSRIDCQHKRRGLYFRIETSANFSNNETLRFEIQEAFLDFVSVRNGPIELNVALAGNGPLIVCVHGFPELWYSWRHQIEYFAARGYSVAALDVRGYGKSSSPHEIPDYTLRCIVSDVAAVIDHLGKGRAILFGHDWGAPIVWHTCLLHPDKVAAVAGLSVPFFPRGAAPFLEIMKTLYKGRFFYQIYF